ncbi:MAG: hypothetical protein GY742_22285 [Hyphomicrobiales bacterium]|nr:hypothetical protein [Hyphomicrobiales bacterium]
MKIFPKFVNADLKVKIVLLMMFIGLNCNLANSKNSFDHTVYSNLKKNGSHLEIYNYLNEVDLSDNIPMLAERGMLYFSSPDGVVEKCSAVRDLEQAHLSGSKWVRPFLEYLYNGAWMPIAAEEGVREAQLLLARSLHMDLLSKTNPMAAFDKKRAYEKIYKFYNAAVKAKNPIFDVSILNSISKEAKQNGFKIDVKTFAPRKIFCEPRN